MLVGVVFAASQLALVEFRHQAGPPDEQLVGDGERLLGWISMVEIEAVSRPAGDALAAEVLAGQCPHLCSPPVLFVVRGSHPASLLERVGRVGIEPTRLGCFTPALFHPQLPTQGRA